MKSFFNRKSESNSSSNKSDSNLGAFLKILKSEDLNFSLQGLVNVESGDISVRTLNYSSKSDGLNSPFSPCDDCEPVEEDVLFFSSCQTCGRANDNYFWLHSGDGDGVYAVLEIVKSNSSDEIEVVGFAVYMVPIDRFAQPMFEKSLEASQFSYPVSILNEESDLEAFEITAFKVPENGVLYISEKTTESDSSDAVYAVHLSNKKPKNLRFLSFSEQVGEPQGRYLNDVSPRPRILVGIYDSILDKNEFKVAMERPEGKEIFQDWMFTGIGSSHLQRMGPATCWFNYEINKGLADANFDNAYRYHNNAGSWLLQGAIHGESDCLEEFPKYEAWGDVDLWLRERHQYSFADEWEKNRKLPFSDV